MSRRRRCLMGESLFPYIPCLTPFPKPNLSLTILKQPPPSLHIPTNTHSPPDSPQKASSPSSSVVSAVFSAYLSSPGTGSPMVSVPVVTAVMPGAVRGQQDQKVKVPRELGRGRGRQVLRGRVWMKSGGRMLGRWVRKGGGGGRLGGNGVM